MVYKSVYNKPKHQDLCLRFVSTLQFKLLQLYKSKLKRFIGIDTNDSYFIIPVWCLSMSVIISISYGAAQCSFDFCN
jgi:hypothetical protein